MVNKGYVLDFLKDLHHNNSKAWMDEHRERYHNAKERWLYEVAAILRRLEPHDPNLIHVRPKACISRINNNRRFHPNRPTYKPFFTCEPAIYSRDVSPFYVLIGAEECFMGGGLWRPRKEALAKFRAAVDYNGNELRELLLREDMRDHFVGLEHDPNRLKVAPQGYANDHPQIDLLRYKNITLMHPLTEAEFLSDAFVDHVEETYLKLQPFVGYLEQAVAYDGD